MTNVISLDVKVYDDDSGPSSLPTGHVHARYPYMFDPTAPLPNQMVLATDPARMALPASANATTFAPTSPINPIVMNQQTPGFSAADPPALPEFVDLGYRGFAENPNTWDYDPTAIPPITWGRQHPARWRSQGHRGHAISDPQNQDPRNTYDTWYGVSNDLHLRRTLPGGADNPDWRPIPYARPLRALQIKLRVLEPRSRIVREAVIVHWFPEN